MAKWNIIVYTDTGYSAYETDSDKQKKDIYKREKAKKSVDEIYINATRAYKRRK